MHSSRMRTGRSLTVFRSLQPGGGVPGPGGVYLVPGGVYLVLGGVPGPGGCTWSQGVYLVLGGVPGPRGLYLVPGGCTWSWGGVPGPGGCVPGPGGCTWSQGVCTWSQGVYLVLGGVPGPRGVYLVLGGCTWSGGVYLVRYSPPVNRMTNRCKNITLAKTSFRPVIILIHFWRTQPSDRKIEMDVKIQSNERFIWEYDVKCHVNKILTKM